MSYVLSLIPNLCRCLFQTVLPTNSDVPVEDLFPKQHRDNSSHLLTLPPEHWVVFCWSQIINPDLFPVSPHVQGAVWCPCQASSEFYPINPQACQGSSWIQKEGSADRESVSVRVYKMNFPPEKNWHKKTKQISPKRLTLQIRPVYSLQTWFPLDRKGAKII